MKSPAGVWGQRPPRKEDHMIVKRLLSVQDITYRDFQRKLIPNLDPETIIGVRTPQLRALAKELRKAKEDEAFLGVLPHETFEENQLHVFLIEGEKDFDTCLALVNSFLPFVDNWATCDQLVPKALAKDKVRLLEQIRAWIASDHPYTVRFGVNCLMRWYLDEDFKPAYLEWVALLRSEDYYVNMVIAWYFATALCKQYGASLRFIKQHRLAPWTHNKTIQKAVESLRITPEQKAYLKMLKINAR